MKRLEKKIILRSVNIIDPKSNTDKVSDVVIANKKIISIENPKTNQIKNLDGFTTYNCKNLILCPGLIDMRVHLHGSNEESISNLQRAAIKSGVLKLVLVPNSNTLLDDPDKIEYLYEKSRNESLTKIFTYGSATKNLDGFEISELGLMSEIGAKGFTDGVNCIQDSLVMRRVMSYAAMFERPVIQHPEDKSLAGLTEASYTSIKGEMNESETSTRLGLMGIPSCAEVIIIERDLRLAKLTNSHYHVSNVSTKESLEAIKKGKEDGINVTCDTAPPYFSLNELELSNYNTSFKLSPPLRSEADRLAIVEGIKNGIIDVITSDHQPRSNDTKLVPFSSASVGACGIETLLPLSLNLVNEGYVNLKNILSMLTENPAKILNLKTTKIEKNSDASFIIVDINKSNIINQDNLLTRPTPFHRRPVQGKNLASFVNGYISYESDEFKNLKNV